MSKPIAGSTPEERQPRPYKIQRPLVSYGPFEYLIYSRRMETSFTMPGPDAVIDQLMGGSPKIFVLAQFSKEGKMTVHHVLPDQGF